jgi:benzodiazapine receptor
VLYPSLSFLSPRTHSGVVSALPQGIFIGRLTRKNVRTFSNLLTKPPLSPPNWLFAPVWTILYLLMGIASYRVYSTRGIKQSKREAVMMLYAVQLVLNFAWSVLYFGWHRITLAMLDSFLLTGLVAATALAFADIDATAGWLMVPYLLWSCFATYLITGIWWLNGATGVEKVDGVTIAKGQRGGR